MELQPTVLKEQSLFHYFQPYVREALSAHSPNTGEDTEFYLVRLLSEFARSQQLFAGMGRQDPALAIQLTSALRSPSPGMRVGLLKRVGDYTLYMAGFFSGGLNTRVVDINYYTQLGAVAYEHLALDRTPGEVCLSSLFKELASGFERFVEVLRQVRDRSRPPTEGEIVNLYSAWIDRGCKTSAKRLSRLGYRLPLRGCMD